jgi:ubiquitin-protein ligase
MSDAKAAAVLARHYDKAARDNSENILFLPDDSNLLVCHLLVVGLPYPYQGGEYILRLTSPNTFPQKPPEARCYTECGVYTPDSLICISIGEFHADDRQSVDGGAVGWRPALGIRGFARELVNGIIVPESLNIRKHMASGRGGLGIEDTTPEVREALARKSAKFNCDHSAKLRAEFLAYAKANPHLKAAQAWLRQIAQTKIPKGATPEETHAGLEAAYGKEFCSWATTLPPSRFSGENILLLYFPGLAEWDSDHCRKGYLATKAIFNSTNPEVGWGLLGEIFPELEKKRFQIQGSSSDTQQLITEYLRLTTRANLDARDALLARL